MSELFTSGKIGSLTLANRMIRTASHEGLADEHGRPTEEQYKFYEGFVKGGIGLVITGYAGIMSAGKSALYHMTMLDSDTLVPAHRHMVEKIHALGGKIILQLAHCGRQTWSAETGGFLQAPSAIPCGFYRDRPDAITEERIAAVIRAFADAAGRAREAGYDGVEIHAAHGYLLSTFLSRYANKRKDQWGGSPQNRFRIVAKTLEAVRNCVGQDFPVLVKLNTYEKPRLGIKEDECVQYAKMVEETGCCDAVELSCGTNADGFVMARGKFPGEALLAYMRPYSEFSPAMKSLFKIFAMPFVKMRDPAFMEGYNLHTAAKVKEKIGLPVITVGGMRSKNFMEAAIREHKTDFVSMARPLILEPDLSHRFKEGLSDKALCDNCNFCVAAADTQSIRCHNTELLAQKERRNS